MDKELFPGAHPTPFLDASARPGAATSDGTEFDATKTQPLKRIRALPAKTKSDIVTYSQYYRRFYLSYYLSTTIITDYCDEEVAINAIDGRDLGTFIETCADAPSDLPGDKAGIEYWYNHVLHRQNLGIPSNITGNIYVKDCAIPTEVGAGRCLRPEHRQS